MPDIDVPADQPGGPSAVSASGELPEKLRVHALAKRLSVTSRQVLDTLIELGAPARGPQSSVDRDAAVRVADSLGVALIPIHEPTDPGVPSGSGSARDDDPGDAAVRGEDLRADPFRGEDLRDDVDLRDEGVRGEDLRDVDLRDVDLRDEGEDEDADEATVAPGSPMPLFAAPGPMFLAPEPIARPARSRSRTEPDLVDNEPEDDGETHSGSGADGDAEEGDDGTDGRRRRRRGRRGRGRGRGSEDQDELGVATDDRPVAAERAGDEAADDDNEDDEAEAEADEDTEDDADEGAGAGSRRRRRRRRRRAAGGDDPAEADENDPPNTVTRVREPRSRDSGDGDGIQGVRGSTRLEAKRQRRRDGRDAGRRRTPVLSEAEFLARREAVERTMVVRQHGERSEIGVLEDGVLVEHFVTSSGGSSLVGNVYLGRVQNVLPSMEAAFIDIGRGRNAVLYAGEVDWDLAGLAGKARRIEQALSSGDSILVQVTKDPVGHKGARLTTQISLPGRFLVYVPSGGTHGISRKLADTERKRLKDLLKEIVPDDAGVIIRTASEGVSQEALERDVRRLQAQWEVVHAKAEAAKKGRGKAPELLYEEPDLMIKVVRDQFNEDFSKLVVAGADAWDTLSAYVGHVAPELAERLHRHVGTGDVFSEYRIDEQLAKALDRKVWLPSGGTLVIDRTEAMTVVDVNTGKFTGSGGNLEETVTRNNLEAAEEIVRQLRLRDIGGIIVVDFIDMVLESNRDLVLRRLTECLGRDRTRHQVAEVTSLGLVQMTRKRVGVGLLEAFSVPCEHCRGRGVVVSSDPVEQKQDFGTGGGGGRRRGRSGGDDGAGRRRGGNGGRGGDGGRVGDQPDTRSEGNGRDHTHGSNGRPVGSPAPTGGDTGAAASAMRSLAERSSQTAPAPDPSGGGDPGPKPADTAVPGPDEAGAASAESGPAESSPAESGPAESGPAEPGPAEPGPAGSGPAGSGPAGSAPAEPAPESAPTEPAPAVTGLVRTRASAAPDASADSGGSEPDAGDRPEDPVGAGVGPGTTGTRPGRRRRRSASRPAGPPAGEDPV